MIMFLFVSVGFAQQEPQFTHYMFNNASTNPGAVGSLPVFTVTALARQQWVDLKDESGNRVAPETYLISVESPVRVLKGGLGLTVMQDKAGYEKNFTVRLAYGYQMQLGSGQLGIGVQGNFMNKSIDLSMLNGVDPNDPRLADKNTESSFFTDLGVGAFYRVPDKLYAGLSSINVLENAKPIGKSSEPITYQLKRTYFLTGGYEIPVNADKSLVLVPSFLLKTDVAGIQCDLNGTIRYHNKFWGGLTYRVKGEPAAIVGIIVNNFQFGYGYDLPTDKLGTLGSHEIMLRYSMKVVEKRKPKMSYRNTRFL
ncbi:MAG: type IX secretion system membrane protein PorP/SprF [Bacteroidota bacterium]|nr:type IX secretion system membrane protein PorP/SprF [Bacteroidota bacterium]